MFKNIHSVVSNHLFMMGILWRFSKSRYVFEFVKIIIESIQPFPNIIFPALIINQIVDQGQYINNFLDEIRLYYSIQLNKTFMEMDFERVETAEIREKKNLAFEGLENYIQIINNLFQTIQNIISIFVIAVSIFVYDIILIGFKINYFG